MVTLVICLVTLLSAAIPKPESAVELLSAAQRDLDSGNYAEAANYATEVATKVPAVSDYAQYLLAQAEYRQKHYKDVDKAVAQVFKFEPISPLVGSAAALAVTANLEGDQPKDALALIRKYFDHIPQPQASLLYAKCLDGNGDLAQAAEYFQRVYYGYPLAKEAAEAATSLAMLKTKLGDGYPPVMPPVMLARAEKLMEYHRSSDARTELTAVIPQLGGTQLEMAQVLFGVADYYAGSLKKALTYFKELNVSDSEADAERLAYIIKCERRLDKASDVKPYLASLEQQHPNSSWRLQSLIDVADQARVANEASVALELYRTCAAVFGRNPNAASCNWRRAYNEYHVGATDTAAMLSSYVTQFPDSEDTTDALYFLGRWYEKQSDNSSARAAYDALVRHFPNTYFGILGAERLKLAWIKGAIPAADTQGLLKSVAWTRRDRYESFKPGALAQKRLSRAEILQTAGLRDYAESELRFGARNDDEQSSVYALNLAKYAMARNAPNEALDYIKTYSPGYLYMPLDQAPLEFWQLAFPIPFRGMIEYFSRDQKLDPYLVTALIRQESDFYTKEVSTSNAIGLMQLIPETGRIMGRHFAIRRVDTSDLMTPDTNIKLGTYFLRTLLERYNGQMEWALAAYNAGPGRADAWRNWGPFEETADLIEAIPIHQTRLYVQIVQRNASVYRRLYAGVKADVPPYEPKPSPTPVIAKKKTKRPQG